MLTSSTESIPLIPMGESSRRVVVFMLELLRGQLLSPAFINLDIVVGLVYEHTMVQPMVVQRLDERNTLLVFAEGENIEKLCEILWSIKIWLGHSVQTGFNVASPKQMMVVEGLHQVGREESVLVEGASTKLPRPMSEPQCEMSCPSVASQVVGKMPKISTLSGDPSQKEEVSFKQWVFKVWSVMQSHTEATLQEGMVWSLCGATADLVGYLGLQEEMVWSLCRATADFVWYLCLQALMVKNNQYITTGI